MAETIIIGLLLGAVVYYGTRAVVALEETNRALDEMLQVPTVEEHADEAIGIVQPAQHWDRVPLTGAELQSIAEMDRQLGRSG